MLLNEIIQTKEKIVNVPFKMERNIRHRKRPVGSGAYSAVYDKQNSVNEVKKRSLKMNSDVFHLYADALIKNKLIGNNTYAPVIYTKASIHTKKLPLHTAHSYEIEKLIPLARILGGLDDSPQNYQFEEIINSLLEKYNIKFDPSEYSNRPLFEAVKAIANYFKQIIEGNATTDDPELKEITDLIRSIIKENPCAMLDMHAGNIMFRQTPYGFQPVITDPIQKSIRC